MSHPDSSFYKSFVFVSSAKNKKIVQGKGAPKYAHLPPAIFLNKIRELHNLTDHEIGAKISAAQQSVNQWRLGWARPNRNTVRRIAAEFGASVDDLLAGRVHDAPAPYGAALSNRAMKLIKRVTKLLSEGESGCLEFIDNQITQAEKIFTVSALHSDRLIPDVRLDPLHDRRRTADVSADTHAQSAPPAETAAAGAVHARRTKKRRSG